MTAPSRTLVAVIGEREADNVLEWTTLQAQPREHVRVLYTAPAASYAMMDWQLTDPVDAAATREAEQRLDEATIRLRLERPDLSVEGFVVDGGELRRHRLIADADLVITCAPLGPARYSVLRELAAAAPCPVLVTGDGPASSATAHSTVVALVRDLATDSPVVEAALAQARARSAGLLVLHPRVIPDVNETPDEPEEPIASVTEQLMLDEWLSGIVEVDADVPVSAEIVSDDEAVLTERITDLALRPALLVAGIDREARNHLPIIDPLLSILLRFRHQPTILVARDLNPVRQFPPTPVGAAGGPAPYPTPVRARSRLAAGDSRDRPRSSWAR